jgi:hypothetical protein
VALGRDMRLDVAPVGNRAHRRCTRSRAAQASTSITAVAGNVRWMPRMDLPLAAACSRNFCVVCAPVAGEVPASSFRVRAPPRVASHDRALGLAR